MTGLALRLYGASLSANVAQGRWRYLAGLPLVALAGALGLRRSEYALHQAGAVKQPASSS